MCVWYIYIGTNQPKLFCLKRMDQMVFHTNLKEKKIQLKKNDDRKTFL